MSDEAKCVFHDVELKYETYGHFRVLATSATEAESTVLSMLADELGYVPKVTWIEVTTDEGKFE